MFSEMILGASDRFSAQLDDLRDYYYLLKWPEHMVSAGVVGPPLTAADVESPGLAPSLERLYA